MSKKKVSTPTVSELLADLKSKGGEHAPWHEVKGADYAVVLREAVDSGQVENTEDDALRLKQESKE